MLYWWYVFQFLIISQPTHFLLVAQIIHGFTKAVFDAHPEVCRTTFKQTIAGSMAGVTVDEITARALDALSK